MCNAWGRTSQDRDAPVHLCGVNGIIVRTQRRTTTVGWEGRLIVEVHRGLGLLWLVVGTSPGFEVWDAAPRVRPVPLRARRMRGRRG